MADNISHDLRVVVIDACNRLFAARQLITNKSVIKSLSIDACWLELDLDVLVPKYINEWRLQNLSEEHNNTYTDKIRDLEAELNKYKVSLSIAQQTIRQMLGANNAH